MGEVHVGLTHFLYISPSQPQLKTVFILLFSRLASYLEANKGENLYEHCYG